MKAFFNPQSGMRHLEGARLITLCISIIILNTVLNIFIFHRHLPSKPLRKVLKRVYIFSTLLCIVAFACLSFFLVPDIIESIGSGEIVMLPFAMAFLLTLTALATQCFLLKYIDKEFKFRVDDQIASLGKDPDLS